MKYKEDMGPPDFMITCDVCRESYQVTEIGFIWPGDYLCPTCKDCRYRGDREWLDNKGWRK